MVRRKVVEMWNEHAEGSPALLAAEMLSRLDPELEVVSSTDGPGRGIVALRDARTGEVADFDFQDLVEGSLRFRSAGGEDVSMDLRADESGGSLVIDADGERVSFELERGAGGATLLIRSSEDEIRLGSGGEALEPPRWLPTAASRPTRPRHVYSARSDEGVLGAVAWESAMAPGAVVESYRRALEGEGFEIVRQSARKNGSDVQASLWARDLDGERHAFVVAALEEGATAVLLGYGERR
jgi:hypothetical protein